MSWTTPKTNWVKDDTFDYRDYNRIVGNLLEINALANKMFRVITIPVMVADADAESMKSTARYLNEIEQALTIVNVNTYAYNIGKQQTFNPNRPFIQWDELNRIESATLRLKTQLDIDYAIMSRLEFVLGRGRDYGTR